jgi:hypothetical protein
MDRRRDGEPHVPGTRQQLVTAALAALAIAAMPAVAHAYHNGAVFDRAPGAGGGGGLFYTGSTRDRGWDCSACHTDPRAQLDVEVTSQPPELIAEQRFRPGTAYAITVELTDPTRQLGLTSTRSNYNGIAASVLDEDSVAAGMINGFDPGRFYLRGSAILASDSTVINETSWTFTWTAPMTSTGALTLDIAVVDGNGANAGGTSTLTDPDGDDVAVRTYVVRDTAASARYTSPRPARPARPLGWIALALPGPVLLLRARRRRTTH